MNFDFEHAVQAPFRMQPGLRKLVPGSAQLTPNRPGSRHLREKLAVLLNWPHEALLQVDGFDAAPALQTLAEQAAAEHAEAWAIGTDGRWHARHLGWSVDASGTPHDAGTRLPEIGLCLNRLDAAWRRAALLCLAFAEDFAIVDGERATLPWLAVCLPSSWSPPDKLGRHFAEVHAPVADNAVLLAAGAQLMRLVTAPQRWERFVWTISRQPRLHTHPLRADPTPWSAEPSADELVQQAWWRTEHQSFIPLPALRQAVFTIGVDVQPLARAIATPGQAARLHDSLASMSPAVLAYRGLDGARDRLLDWLARRAVPPSA